MEMVESLGRLVMIVAGSSIEMRVGSCEVGRAIVLEEDFAVVV